MKERPVLFSGLMVRALLAGTKTQTRRAVKPPPPPRVAGLYRPFLHEPNNWQGFGPDSLIHWYGRCPHGVPGDLLWVRERCWIFGQWHEEGTTPTGRRRWRFKAIGQRVLFDNPGHEQIAYLGRGPGWSYRNSIHMPRWASRITLRITDVRVERLNDCSEADALAEGVCWSDLWQAFVVPGVEHPNKDFPVLSRATAREMYAALWDTINGSGEWLANPWVWAVTFERVS